MTTDINNLDLLPPNPVDWGAAGAGEKKAFLLVPKGRYTLTRKPGSLTIGATNDKFLQATFTAIVSDPGQLWDGQELRYQRLSTRPWNDRASNFLADYLKEAGYPNAPTTNEEYVAALALVEGAPFRARVDWRSYCKLGGFELKGMDSHPLVDGIRRSINECPECKKNGIETKVFANAEIKGF